MNIISDIFSLKGSIPRLRYLIANITVAFVVTILVMCLLFFTIGSAMGAASANPGANGLYFGISMILIFVLGIFYLFATINLLMKRLRDIGHSSLHAIWIICLNAFGQMILIFPSGRFIGALMVLITFIAQIYLVFAKGNNNHLEVKDVFS